MRVFELARELNMPGKDLIERIRSLGFEVEGNFNILDAETVGTIKAKMLEPVTRVEQETEEASDEVAEQPRRRRIISARRSAEVHRIQESLGESGPLPEDKITRSEVGPAESEEPAAEAAPEETPPAEASEAPAAGEPAAVDEPAESAPVEIAAARPAQERPAQPPESAEPRIVKPVKVADRPESGLEKSIKAKDTVKLAGPGAPGREGRKGGESEKGRWREFKRGDHKPGGAPHGGADGWVRPQRKGGTGRRGHRAARRPVRKEGESKHIFGPRKKAIRLGQALTVSELAGLLGVKAGEIIRKLMAMDIMATINDHIEGATGELIAAEYNIEVEVDTNTLEDMVKEVEIDPAKLELRPPIVTIMGHVDHGKTSLLDFIRTSKITSTEAGGITQHIGAYHVKSETSEIVFLDTPGHEAFTSLRARGANITDLVVLVVAADDGVMPQTVEAIDHARAAGVPILVALNKMDRPGADPEKIKRQLMEHELLAEEFGGETVIVPVSAKTGEGVEHLLEMIHLQAEMLELKTTSQDNARGYVIESKMDRRRGAVATVIVQRGTLRTGQYFVAGTSHGRVRALFNDQSEPVDEVTPSLPAEVLGFAELPQAGDVFVVMEDEKTAKQIAQSREEKKQEAEGAEKRRMHLEDFILKGRREEADLLNLILKADAQGSLEALRSTLEKLGNEQAHVNIIRASVGGITETDVSLASTTESVVIGFNVRADSKATELGRSEGVDIKRYNIIYDIINDVRDALQGLLKPIIREEVIGHFEVRQLFSLPKEGKVAGGYITDGRMERNCQVRLYRDDVLVHSSTLSSLRRFKEDVQNVATGYECGLRIANFNDIKVGDVIEAYINVEEAQTLDNTGNG